MDEPGPSNRAPLTRFRPFHAPPSCIRQFRLTGSRHMKQHLPANTLHEVIGKVGKDFKVLSTAGSLQVSEIHCLTLTQKQN